MNLFEKLAEDDGAAKSKGQLAAMTGADPVLLSKVRYVTTIVIHSGLFP